MNCAYRLIWNEQLNAWVVAPEIASARGKRGQVKRSAAALMLTLAIGAHAALAADLAATALPGGGQISAGQATISSNGAAMMINQGSQRAIINWQNFDIGSQASVNFQQPNTSAVTLNRASGPTASRIEGQLSANGQVFLINPNGVLFGSGARVNVGGLVASTLNIRDADFLAGNYVFSGNSGSIINEGQITAAPGGYLAFISPSITNNGAISAPQGTVAMGAGERVRLNFAGDRLVSLDVSASAIDTLITNNQAIRADGGAILLTAAGAEAVTRSVINNTGVLEANSLTSDSGRIVLTAGNDINLGAASTVAVDSKKGGEITVQAKAGTLLADGSISARGTTGTGGSVQLLGHQVGLINAAQVDASGATGGGTVLVGGDYQGGNAAIQNAFRTYVGPQATIKANGLQQGNGGKVVVWADDITRLYGSISAKGGAKGGNGGFAEVSGKRLLDFRGAVDLGAELGVGGNLLLDPLNITISNAADTNTVGFNPPADQTQAWNDDPGLNSVFDVTAGTGSFASVANNTTITLEATNNITVANAFNLATATGKANVSLNMRAGNDIAVNAGVTAAGSGTLTLTADANFSGSGGPASDGIGSISGTGALTQTAGTMTLAAGSGITAITITPSLTINNTTSGNVAIANTGALSLAGVTVGGAGTFSLTNNASVTQTVAPIATNTLAATLSAGSLNLGTAANNIANLGVVTAPTGFTLNNGANPITVGANISTTNSAVTITTTNAYTQGNFDITSGSGAITVNANAISLAPNTGNNAFITSGALTLRPTSTNVSTSLAGANPFDLTAAEIAAFGSGLTGSLTIGNTGATAATNMTVGGNVAFNGRAVTLNAGLGAYNQGDFDVANSAGAITVQANAISLAPNTGNNAFITSGALTLQPTSTTVSTSLAGANAFDLTAAEIAAFGAGLTGSLVVGRTNATAATNMTVGGNVAFNGRAVTLNAGLGAYNQGDFDVANSAGAITVQANAISLAPNTGNNAFITSGALTLRPTSTNVSTSLAGANPFDLTAAEIAAFGSGLTGSLTIGNTGATAATNMTVGGNVAFNGRAVTLNAGLGAYNQGDFDVANSAGAITVQANAISLAPNTGNNAFITSGALTLQPTSTTVSTSLAGANAFDLTAAEIAAFGAGLTGSLVVGRTNATAATNMTVGGNVAFNGRAVTLNAGLGAYNQGDFDVANSAGAITVQANAISLAPNTGNNAFITSGALTLRPTSTNVSTSLAGANPFDLTAAEIAAFGSGLTGSLTIGNTGATAATNMTVGGNVAFNGRAVTLNAGLGAYNQGDFDVANSAGAITVQANAISLAPNTGNNAFITSGALTLQPTSTTVSTSLAGANAFDLTAAEIAAFGAGLTGSLVVGRTNATAATNMTVGGNVAFNGRAVTLNAGLGAYNQGDFDVANSAGAITVQANAISLAPNTGNNAFQTTGVLTLRPTSATTAMSLAGASAFDLTAAEVTDLSGGVTGAGSIVIGNAAASTGAMTIGGAVNFGAKTVSLIAGSITDGGNVHVITARDLNLRARNAAGAIGAAGANNPIDVAVTNLTANTNNGSAFITSASGFNLGIGAATSSVGTGQLNLNVTAGGSITQSTAVVANTLTASLAGAASALNLGTSANNITNIGAITAPAGFTLNNGNNPTTVTGAINTGASNGAVSINTGTAAAGYTQQNVDITSGSGPITITSNAVNIAANTGNNAFQTTGVLTLKPFTATAAMSLAGAPASTFDLSATEVTDLSGGVTGAGSIVIGDAAASTGAMTVGGAVNFGGKPVSLNAGSFTDGNTTGRTISAGSLNLNARTGTIGTAVGNDAIDVATTNLTFNTVNQGAFINSPGAGALNLGPGNSAVGTGAIGLTVNGAITQSALSTITGSGTTTLAAGAGNNITLNNAGNNFSTVAVTSANNVTLHDANAINLSASTLAGNLLVTAGGNITLSGVLTAGGSGDAIVLAAGGNFNNAGSYALNPGSGRFLVWSQNPALDNRGGLAYDFKQYNATYGSTTPAQATGNGFLYALAPTITPGLTGTVSKVYDATTAATLAAGNFTATGAVDGDVIALSGTGTYDNPNVAGSPIKPVTATGIAATVTSSVADGSKPVYGYTLTSTTANANIGEITPAPLTITGATGSSVYSAAAQTNTYSSSGLLTGNGDSVTGVSTLASGTNVGTYADNLTSATGSGLANYTIGYVNGSLTITPAPLTITGGTTSSLYTAAAQTNTFSTTGLLGSDSVTSVATLASGTNVGTYADNLTSATGSGLTNYTIGYVNGSLTITPAPLTITGDTTSSLYTSSLQTNTFSTTGLLGSDSVTSVATLASGTNVGTYADNLTSATGSGLTNYTIGYVNGSLTITPAPLTITANDASRPVNTLNPQFSATYSGFVGGETPAMLNGVLAFATPATLTSPVGIYPITPYGQSSGNYTITYLDGDLTVYGAPVITPTLPREVVSQQAIGAQYTDPTMLTDVPTGLYYAFDDDHDSKIEKVPASMVRVVGSGIRLRN